MAQETSQSVFYRFNDWVQRSVTIKLLSIGFLILILLIPASMIEGLISDRQYASESAILEVSSKWGERQLVAGPILSLPYKKYVKNAEGNIIEVTEYIHFLPETLKIQGTISPEKRHRGIYDVVVYTASLTIEGEFPTLDVENLNVDSANVIWKDARLNLGITDMRGIQKSIAVQWNDAEHIFDPSLSNSEVLQTGVSASVPVTWKRDAYSFGLSITLNGSGELNVLPLGKVTTLDLQAPWTTPKFDGSFLPDEYTISENGFEAHWEVLHLNRNYPQKWIGTDHTVEYSEFGVDLLLPVDQYQKSMRSAKYAIMFIALTFMILFFTEVLNRKRIHPFQYILTGLALCIFYLLLLSLSEHIGFNAAYIVSSIAILTMVTAYAATIFKHRKLTLLTGGIIFLLYAFLFTTLQLQDYALLMGSLGLFFVMAVIMYLSRKVDWYRVGEASVKQPKPQE